MNAKTIVNRLLEDYDADLDAVSPESVSASVSELTDEIKDAFNEACSDVCAGEGANFNFYPDDGRWAVCAIGFCCYDWVSEQGGDNLTVLEDELVANFNKHHPGRKVYDSQWTSMANVGTPDEMKADAAIVIEEIEVDEDEVEDTTRCSFCMLTGPA